MTEVTYGRLDRALRSLGFSVRVAMLEAPQRVYKHQESGALIMLPALPLDKEVFPYHLAGVQGTLDNFGIASAVAFAQELESAS